MKDAAEEILREAELHLSTESGRSADELANAAACYAACGNIFFRDRFHHRVGLKPVWPWSWNEFGARSRRRRLVRAGALILAALAQLEREEAKAPSTEQLETVS